MQRQGGRAGQPEGRSRAAFTKTTAAASCLASRNLAKVFISGGPPSSGGRMSKYVTRGFLGLEGSAGESDRDGDLRRGSSRRLSLPLSSLP
jgi:hypothetical protein